MRRQPGGIYMAGFGSNSGGLTIGVVISGANIKRSRAEHVIIELMFE